MIPLSLQLEVAQVVSPLLSTTSSLAQAPGFYAESVTHHSPGLPDAGGLPWVTVFNIPPNPEGVAQLQIEQENAEKTEDETDAGISVLSVYSCSN